MARRPSPIVQRLALQGGDEVIAELKKMGLAGEVAGRKLKASFDEVNKSGLDPFTASLKRAQQQMQTLSRSFASIGREFTNVGRTMTFAITAPVVAGFGFAIKAATDFESKMADIARVTDIPTPDGLQQLGEALRAMAVDLGVSIGDLQDIAQAAGQAGIPFADLAGFTEQVAKGAVALNLSFGETGQSLAKIQAALGLTVPQIGLLVDAVAKLADDGAAADAEIIQVVQTIGALGKQADLSELEIAALGASLISMGVDSESAGTALRNMILNLSSGAEATDPFRAALAQLGLDAEDVAQRLQTDGIGVILDLFERLRQQAPEVRLALLQGLFDRRAAQSLAPLITSLETLERNLETVADKTLFAGRAQEEFDRRSETSQQRIREFYTALEDLGIVIGQEVLPTFTDLAVSVTDLLKAFADSGPIVQWGVKIAAVAAAVGPVIFALGQTFNAISTVARGAALLTGAFIKLNATIAAGGLLASLAALGSSLGAFLAVAGLVAGAGGLLFLATRQDTAARAADSHRDVIDQLNDGIKRLKGEIPSAGEQLETLAQQHLDSAEAALEDAEAQLRFAEAARRGERGPGGVPSEQERDIARARDAVAAQAARVEELRAKLAEVRTAAREANSGVEDINRSTEDLGKTADEAGEKIKRAFPGPAANVRSLRDNPFAPVSEGAKNAGDDAEESGKRVEAAFGKVVSVTETLGPAASRAASETARSVETIAPAVEAVGTAIQETKDDLLTIGPAFEELGGAFTGAGESVTLFGSVANDTLHGIEEQATSTAAALPGLFQTAASTMAQAFAAAFAQVRSELAALQSAVTAALSAMAASLAALRREIAATMQAASAAQSSASAGGGGGGSGFWQGGQVFGPGTATSDSIPAWLSAGEFVVRAKAVDHYGPQLFAAMNSLRLPRFDVPRFNAGGIVDSISHSIGALRFNTGGPVPAMAGAGNARDMGVLRLSADAAGDGFRLQGPVDVLDTFSRAMNRAGLTKAGRGPARLRG